MKPFVKYFSLAALSAALLMAASPVAEAGWTQITHEGLRTSDRDGKPGHFQFFSESEIYGMSGNGAVYLWGAGKTPTSPWEETDRKTSDGATDHFFVSDASPKQIYGLGNNGAVYRNEPSNKSWLHMITNDGARTTSPDRGGKPGHFQLFTEAEVYGLGQDGAIYRTEGSQAWSRNVAGSGVVDHFYVTPDRSSVYGLGANGGIFKWNAGTNTWDSVTPSGLRTSTNNGKAGYFQYVSATKFYGLGGDGNVYVWESPATSWTKVTDHYGVVNDAFHVTSAGVVYGLSGNGAVYRWDVDAAVIDTIAPIISAVSAAPTATGATITWATNESATSVAEYGLTTTYEAGIGTDVIFTTNHSIAISGLTANTLYHYRVKSTDAAGNLATSGDYTFTTLSADSITAPAITTCAGGLFSSVAISWQSKAGETSYIVDIDDDNNWSDDGFWHKTGITTTSTIAPDGFTGFSGKTGNLAFSGGSIYWVRVFYPVAGTHSSTAQFTAPSLCTGGGTGTPTITSLSTTSGTVGSLVTITGSNFTSTANTVNFGSTAITNLSSSGATLLFSVPNVTAGTYNVSVTNANGISNNDKTFTVTTVSGTGSFIVTLTPNLTSANPGQAMTVSWMVNQGTAQVNALDWIGLFQSGAGNTAYVDFKYLTADTDTTNPCSTSNIGGCVAGILAFNAPATPGSYQFRYLPRNSYIDVGRSAAVLVQGDITTAPSLTFTASPTAISTGQPSTLSWSTTNVTSCTASRGTSGWAGSKSTSGSLSVSPTATTGFDLSCTGTGGTASKSVDIVVTPTVSIEQCDTAAAAAKIGEAASKLSSCVAGVTADCGLAYALLAEATTILAGCGTVSPPGVPFPSQLSDGMAVKTNAAIYVRSSPVVSSSNKLNGGVPLPIGANGTINCTAHPIPASGVTAPTPANCGVPTNGYIWWYVEWESYNDGYSAEQSPDVAGLIVPATGSATVGPISVIAAGNVIEAPPASSIDRQEDLRQGLAQISAGVAEVAGKMEQLLKDLGR
jgi:hypothetical protein